MNGVEIEIALEAFVNGPSQRQLDALIRQDGDAVKPMTLRAGRIQNRHRGLDDRAQGSLGTRANVLEGCGSCRLAPSERHVSSRASAGFVHELAS